MEKKTFASSSSQPNMISPSSSFKPKLNDQDYMELVCENGQILAKGRRPKNTSSCQNRRTKSLLDLYKIEYDEGFKKKINNTSNNGESQVVPISESQQEESGENHEHTNNQNKKIKSSKIEFERNVWSSNKRVESSTLIDNSLKGLKNVQVVTTPPPPDEQSAAVGRSTELYFASSSMLSSRDQGCYSLKRKYGDIEEEESTNSSNNSDDETDDDAKTRVPAKSRKQVIKRKRTTEVHKLCEKKRRNEMNEKMLALQDLLPNCYKDDKVSLLDEAIKYMKTLQLQLQMMSMGNGLVRAPPMMLPMGHYSPMSLGMHMGPQFLPQGTGFPGINNASSPMLSFLHHPTGLIPNAPMFSPLESYSPQYVVPSCVPHTQTQATSITQFPRSASTSNLEDITQFRGSNGYYHSR